MLLKELVLWEEVEGSNSLKLSKRRLEVRFSNGLGILMLEEVQRLANG